MDTNTPTPAPGEKTLRPFIVEPSKPTDIGVGNGVNIVRTMIRQSQTNNRFSCVEVYLAPRRDGAAHPPA